MEFELDHLLTIEIGIGLLSTLLVAFIGGETTAKWTFSRVTLIVRIGVYLKFHPQQSRSPSRASYSRDSLTHVNPPSCDCACGVCGLKRDLAKSSTTWDSSEQALTLRGDPKEWHRAPGIISATSLIHLQPLGNCFSMQSRIIFLAYTRMHIQT